MQQNMFIGNLTKKPVLKHTLSGKKICNFKLISNEYIRKDEETGEKIEREVTVYFTAFSNIAEYICKYADIGYQLIVDHRIENNSYIDKDTGETIFRNNHIVLEVQIGKPGKLTKEEIAEECFDIDKC